MNDTPFWQTKTLEQMNAAEWESLCDGCGRCCLNKLEDWDTGEIIWTSVRCRLLDDATCRCSDYENRQAQVPDCIGLTPKEVRSLSWLPPTCGYRLVRDGEDLYWWHHLISGSRDTVHEAGVSVRGRTVPEEGIRFQKVFRAPVLDVRPCGRRQMRILENQNQIIRGHDVRR